MRKIDDLEVENIELSNDGKFLWIHCDGTDVKVLVKRVVEALDSNSQSVDFSEFWNKYHKVTGLPKTDMQAAKKYWKKLTKREKKSALENIEPYYKSLPIYNNGRPVKKARTYLGDKNFNDEFEVVTNISNNSDTRADGKPIRITIMDVAVNNYSEFEQYCRENGYNPETGESITL